MFSNIKFVALFSQFLAYCVDVTSISDVVESPVIGVVESSFVVVKISDDSDSDEDDSDDSDDSDSNEYDSDEDDSDVFISIGVVESSVVVVEISDDSDSDEDDSDDSDSNEYDSDEDDSDVFISIGEAKSSALVVVSAIFNVVVPGSFTEISYNSDNLTDDSENALADDSADDWADDSADDWADDSADDWADDSADDCADDSADSDNSFPSISAAYCSMYVFCLLWFMNPSDMDFFFLPIAKLSQSKFCSIKTSNKSKMFIFLNRSMTDWLIFFKDIKQ